MAREDRLIRERIETQPIKTPILSTDHIKYIKNTIIDALRDTFSRDPDYTYIKSADGIFPEFDNENLGIVITDVFSYDVEFLPAVTVRINGSNLMPVSFNQNQFTYDYGRNEQGQLVPLWQEFSGLYKTSVTVNIHTWDVLAREELVGRIAILFKHVLRDQLYADFGLFVEKVSVGGETETDFRGDELMIFSQSVTLEVLTGWNNRIPVGESLEAINIQIMGDAAPHIYPPGQPKGGPCGGGGAWKVSPTKQDLEDSNRVDWVDEIRNCPQLVLVDALEFDLARDMFILTNDWYQILITNCGVIVEEAATQINTGSWLREALLEAADKYRQKAVTLREHKTSGFKSGSPATGFKYRFSDGTWVLVDDTVVFPGQIEVQVDGTARYKVSGVTIDPQNNVTAAPNVDIDAWANPFTAMTLEGLDAFQFFFVLLDVNSPTRQSPMDLNKLVDDFVSTLSDAHQIAVIEGVRSFINDLLKSRFLLNKQFN